MPCDWQAIPCDGRPCCVTGRPCLVTGRACLVTGRACLVTGRACLVTGRPCLVTGRPCFPPTGTPCPNTRTLWPFAPFLTRQTIGLCSIHPLPLCTPVLAATARKEKKTLFSNHNGSLLRRQPGPQQDLMQGHRLTTKSVPKLVLRVACMALWDGTNLPAVGAEWSR